jgi:hypothetical protein
MSGDFRLSTSRRSGNRRCPPPHALRSRVGLRAGKGPTVRVSVLFHSDFSVRGSQPAATLKNWSCHAGPMVRILVPSSGESGANLISGTNAIGLHQRQRSAASAQGMILVISFHAQLPRYRGSLPWRVRCRRSCQNRRVDGHRDDKPAAGLIRSGTCNGGRSPQRRLRTRGKCGP